MSPKPKASSYNYDHVGSEKFCALTIKTYIEEIFIFIYGMEAVSAMVKY